MIQSNKDILLKDLCARLPYDNTIIKVFNDSWERCEKGEFDNILIFQYIEAFKLGRIKILPYLRTISDMIEDEYAEWTSITEVTHLDNGWEVPCMPSIDWLNKNYFDYRGLIPMGLALEAPGGM